MSERAANKKRECWAVELSMDMVQDEAYMDAKRGDLIQLAVSKGASPDRTFWLHRNDQGGVTLYAEAVEA